MLPPAPPAYRRTRKTGQRKPILLWNQTVVIAITGRRAAETPSRFTPYGFTDLPRARRPHTSRWQQSFHSSFYQNCPPTPWRSACRPPCVTRQASARATFTPSPAHTSLPYQAQCHTEIPHVFYIYATLIGRELPWIYHVIHISYINMACHALDISCSISVSHPGVERRHPCRITRRAALLAVPKPKTT